MTKWWLLPAALTACVAAAGSAGGQGAPWKACGKYSNAQRKIAIASYHSLNLSCPAALQILLAARQRRLERPATVRGFLCFKQAGEAESWYVCLRARQAVWAHAVSF